MPKSMGSVLAANCDKIQPGSAVIIAFEPDAAAMVFLWIVGHDG